MGARFRILVLGGCLLLGILVASWPVTLSHDARGSLVVQAAPPSQAPFDYIVTIVMNNASAKQVYGVSAAPYMNSLASNYGYATGYSDVAATVSDPNYIALLAGSTLGLTADCYPTECPVNAVNIVDRIETAGLTWKAWAEDYPVSQGCNLSPSNAEYNSKHFPFLYFRDITNNPARCSNLLKANSVVTSSVETDDLFLKSLGSTSSAANYNWLTPNQCDDIHDCSLSTGDKYLSQLVPKILSSYIFTTHNAALFVVFAESSGTSVGNVPAIWAGPVAKTKFQSSKSYNHYSLLTTIETAWGLSSLTSNDGSASAMTEFFKSLAPQTTLSYTPTSPAAGDSISFKSNPTGGTPPYTFSWNFGDSVSNMPGGTSLPNTMTHTYASPGAYAVKVNATDTSGKIASATATITVVASLVVTVSGPSSGIIGTSINFAVAASGGTSPYSFVWNFGDGISLASGTTSTASHTYVAIGTYIVRLNATDAKGRLAQASASIAINPTSLAVAVTGPSSGEVGLGVSFTATVSGGTLPYVSFGWNFGDGSTGSGSPVAHVYAASGTYSVTVTVKDSAGITAISPSHSVVVAASLQVSSVGTAPNPSEAGFSISFSATISGGVSPVSCSWNFGDGSSPVSGCSSTHAYSSAANFTATVTATDTLGVTAARGTTITVSSKLTVTVTASTPNAGVGQSVTFNAKTAGGAGTATCNWNFGDGSTGSGCSATHAYTTQGTFTTQVTATDTLAVTATASVTLNVGSTLAIILNVSPNPTEPTVSPTFVATATGGTSPYTSYSWTFGDATTATTTTATTSHAYTSPGTFSVTVTVADSAGNTATSSVSVTVKAKLAVTVAGSPNPAEVGASVGFTAPTTGGVGTATCMWTFGDGGTASACSASHTYITTGTFNGVVTATDTLGVTATINVSVTVNARLTLTATAGPNPTDGGVPVSFAPVSAGGVGAVTCSWNFGDTTSGTGCSTGHTYTSAGAFTATVTVTDGIGVTVTASVTVTVNPVPGVDFSFSPAKPLAGQSVTFTATTTGGSSPFRFSWNYGDGGSSSGNPVGHTYTAAGAFNVTVTATDGVGKTTSMTHALAVTQDFGVSITSITPFPSEIGVSTSFVATAIGGQSPYTFIWDLGDGGPAVSGNPVTHVYTASGAFAVKLSTIDSASHTTTATQTLTVNSRLAVMAAASPSQTDAGVPISFASTSTGGVGSLVCNWSFGDGWSASGCYIAHTYSAAGSFTAGLAAVDALGVTASASLAISVTAAPVADFTFSPASPTTGQSVTFTATTSGGVSPFTFSWNYGDGTIDNSGSPATHAYAASGIFTVNLTTKDANRATTVSTLSITVAENKPPVLSGLLAVQKVSVGQPLTFAVTAFDPEGGSVSIVAEGLPSGASFDHGIGQFSWTPTAYETGNYSITFTAVDSGTPPKSTSQTITIQVRSGPSQICPNCNRTLGLPVDDAVAAGLGFLGSISVLITTIFVGMRDRSELDVAGSATNHPSWIGGSEDGIPGQDPAIERMEDGSS